MFAAVRARYPCRSSQVCFSSTFLVLFVKLEDNGCRYLAMQIEQLLTHFGREDEGFQPLFLCGAKGTCPLIFDISNIWQLTLGSTSEQHYGTYPSYRDPFKGLMGMQHVRLIKPFEK